MYVTIVSVACGCIVVRYYYRGHSSVYAAQWGEGVRFPRKKRYEDARFNIISVTRGLVGVEFPEKSVT